MENAFNHVGVSSMLAVTHVLSLVMQDGRAHLAVVLATLLASIPNATEPAVNHVRPALKNTAHRLVLIASVPCHALLHATGFHAVNDVRRIWSVAINAPPSVVRSAPLRNTVKPVGTTTSNSRLLTC